MAGSQATRQALAGAFKELVRAQGFEKVSVSQVCQACRMGRKTFYYHFRDKYELAQWIFETEFIEAGGGDGADRWELILALCRYFYRERDFYADLLRYHGQNAFGQYFQAYLQGVLEPFILPEPGAVEAIARRDGVDPETARKAYAHFISDALLWSIFRWLSGGGKQPPEQFVRLLKSVTDLVSARVAGGEPAHPGPAD